MRNIKLRLAYDGTNYYGWQKQSDLITVGGTVESCLMRMLEEEIRVTCASRTDAGAHAYGQVINFSSETNIPLHAFPRAINSYLPKDIVVDEVSLVPPEFHARFSAKYRRYRYLISTAAYRPVFLRYYAYWIPFSLNLDEMKQAAKVFIGEHNFTPFASRLKEIKSFVRQVISLEVIQNREMIEIEITANAFLPNMARSIVGSLIEVGKDKLSREDLSKILSTSSHSSHPIAPAHGLYLVEVGY